MPLGPMTAESRAKAQATKKARRSDPNLIPEAKFDRAPYWEKAAHAVGVPVLPDWSESMTVTRMQQWMNRLGLSRSDVGLYLGNGKSDVPTFFPKRFIEQNPRWPLAAFVGTIIENCMITYHDAKGNFTVDRRVSP